MFGILSALAGPLIGGVLNKKAKKEERAQGVEDTLLQLPRLRQSAEDAGFNPLTALLATGGQGFNNIPSSAAPLASTAVITNTIRDVSDIVTGRDALERERVKAETNLAQIQAERLRAGGAAETVSRTKALPGTGYVGVRPRASTGSPRTLTQPALTPGKVETGTGDNHPIAPGRELEELPVTNTPGVFELENRLTGGKKIIIPGDSEPWGVDELATAVGVGLPQLIWHGVKDVANTLTDPAEWEAIRKHNERRREITAKPKPAKNEAQRRRDELERKKLDERFYPNTRKN